MDNAPKAVKLCYHFAFQECHVSFSPGSFEIALATCEALSKKNLLIL
jgi:hypothetical protein